MFWSEVEIIAKKEVEVGGHRQKNQTFISARPVYFFETVVPDTETKFIHGNISHALSVSYTKMTQEWRGRVEY